MRWDETRKAKIRNQLVKKITPFMKEVTILREGKNIFGEYEKDQICLQNERILPCWKYFY